MSEYWQAKSAAGHIVHAVRANTDSTIETGSYYTYAKPICGKIKGRDAWGNPTMRLHYDPLALQFMPFDLNRRFACARCCNLVQGGK